MIEYKLVNKEDYEKLLNRNAYSIQLSMYSRVQQLKHEATGIKENIIVDEELTRSSIAPRYPRATRNNTRR